MRVGTLPDRMAAFVVKIQDSPIHNLQHLQTLLSMVKVQSKQQCIMSAGEFKFYLLCLCCIHEKKRNLVSEEVDFYL